MTDGNIKYYPDFIYPTSNTIIELKGYEKESSVNKKTSVAEKLGYKVLVLRKSDLKDIFEYVSKKFSTKKFETLYDSYKPKYSYKCDFCENFFEKDVVVKTSEKFCSRQCAGKFRALLT